MSFPSNQEEQPGEERPCSRLLGSPKIDGITLPLVQPGRLNVISRSSSTLLQYIFIYLLILENTFNSTIKRLEVLVELTFQCELVLIKIQSVSHKQRELDSLSFPG